MYGRVCPLRPLFSPKRISFMSTLFFRRIESLVLSSPMIYSVATSSSVSPVDWQIREMGAPAAFNFWAILMLANSIPSSFPCAIPSFKPCSIPSFRPCFLPCFRPCSLPCFKPFSIPSFKPFWTPLFSPLSSAVEITLYQSRKAFRLSSYSKSSRLLKRARTGG